MLRYSLIVLLALFSFSLGSVTQAKEGNGLFRVTNTISPSDCQVATEVATPWAEVLKVWHIPYPGGGNYVLENKLRWFGEGVDFQDNNNNGRYDNGEPSTPWSLSSGWQPWVGDSVTPQYSVSSAVANTAATVTLNGVTDFNFNQLDQATTITMNLNRLNKVAGRKIALRFEAVNITKAPLNGPGTENNVPSIGTDQSILTSLGIIPLKAYSSGVQIPAAQSQVQGDTDSGPDVKYQFWVSFDTLASSISFDLITMRNQNSGTTTAAAPITSASVPITSGAVPITSGALPITSGALPITSGAVTTGVAQACSFDCSSGTLEDRILCLEAALCQLQAPILNGVLLTF